MKKTGRLATVIMISDVPSGQETMLFTTPIIFSSCPICNPRYMTLKHCTGKVSRTKDMDGGRVLAHLSLSGLLRTALFIINCLNHFIFIMLT